MSFNVKTNINTSESKTCTSCKEANLPCYGTSRPCLNCFSFGKLDTCVDSDQGTTIQRVNKSKIQKRGSRPQVASACIHCKVAHLACDVSRPCKRCVSLNKADTCQDVLHKKRGRPKRKDQSSYPKSEYSYEIIYGTVETPAINNHNAVSKRRVIKPANHTKPIAFVHESFHPSLKDTPPVNTKNVTSNSTVASTPISATVDEQEPPFDTVLAPSQFEKEESLLHILPQPQNFLTDEFELFNTDLMDEHDLTPKVQQEQQEQQSQELTMILSMEICCAKVPIEVYALWGYHPQELAHRSLYDFISPKDTDRLSQLHRLLLDHTSRTTNHNDALPSVERSTSPLFSTADPIKLKGMANGSKVYSDTIHVKMGSGEYKLYEVMIYIGAGLGADLYDPSTLSKLYIVATFKEHQYEVSLVQQEHQKRMIPDTTQTMTNYMEPIAVFSPLSCPVTPPPPAAATATLDLSAAILDDSKPVDCWLTDQMSLLQDTFNYKIPSPKQRPSPRTSFSLPKFNIAPISTKNISKSYSSAMFSRYASSPKVYHPAQQYFLQTSSSLLNSAATAAKSPSIFSMAGSSNRQEADPVKKIEMSIHSLLC
ncbi:hypothetical protein G6F46_008014 [Rhizopus delemar]|uniref:Zn(2)-C6 fungal-type domain-containing protein n=2 Tax=Rhizopus TaxID=4842 RepID=A0A9P6YZP8_9FUNG|nr:hypothetical protein G6F55_006935 [Rhizopus delemar]KAG1540763.1 hypothetical protein G6F51_008322 [Rhizopus arrhizus]KAG1498680.1 hypothetical protein G6F54_004914 [Rhizopus delemar]KAG1517196.1 hypothetical protein G6F53_001571 [Rhizopus delemar]KAG1550993.1 hypothetical protein G6F49_009120 [Rhizopus delemar]